MGWVLHLYIVVPSVCDDMHNCAIHRLCLSLGVLNISTFLEKYTESHEIHISITPSKYNKRSVCDTSPTNGKYIRV